MRTTRTEFKRTEVGKIPEDWKFEELDKHAKITMGQSPESIYYNSVGNGTLFLQGIRTFGHLYPKYDTWTTRVTKLAKRGSILLSVRAPVGEVNLADNEVCIGRGLMSIDGENNQFVFYLFKAYKDYVIGRESGTVYGSVTRDDVAKLRFPFPNEIEQKAIAKILFDLDSKIELNQQMNKTLESIATAIFKHWFVDFEFPNEEGKPYKSSGGEMVYNEAVGKELPKGWKISKLGDEIEVGGGTTPDTNVSSYWENGDINWATPKDLSALTSSILTDTERKITPKGLASIGSRKYPSGTLLMSSRAPIGYLAISEIDVAVNQGIIAMVCNRSLSSFFMLEWCRSSMAQIENRANGTTFREISKSSFRSMPICVPPESILSIFDSLAESLYSRIRFNVKQSQILTKIRDTLLPKLMSGKIRVPVEAR